MILKPYFSTLITLLAVLILSSQAFAQVNLEVHLLAHPQTPVAGEVFTYEVPVAGEVFTYEVTIINFGPSDATDVEYIDTLPPGFTFVEDANGSCTETSTMPSNIECRPAGNAFFKLLLQY